MTRRFPLSQIEIAIGQLPKPLRANANRSWERICEQIGFKVAVDQWSKEDCATLVRLFACSDYASAASLRQWQWFSEALTAGRFSSPPVACLRLRADECDEGVIKSELRLYRHRQMLHILWREYALLASPNETLKSLSRLADELLVQSQQFAERSLSSRFGVPENQHGRSISLVVLAMGKLGGFELNFSSDIDLIFLYPSSGTTNGSVELSADQYFTRVARLIVRLLDDVTEDGFVFRVDTRLRPFGDSGPLVVSFNSLESYLLQHGRSWERYAYVKARVAVPGIVGDTGSVASRLLQETIEPFVYRRYLDYGVFDSLREMHAMIADEAGAQKSSANIKIGPGGIREIEFIVQSLQLVRGGSNDKLRCPELEPALRELERRQLLPRGHADRLLAAYRFLRRLENFIQAIRDQQTHELPDDCIDQARLALAMEFDGWDALDAELAIHRSSVSQSFREIAFRANNEVQPESPASSFESLWDARGDADNLTRLLTRLGFSAAGDIAVEIISFADSAEVKRIDASAEERLRKLMPGLLSEFQQRESPGKVLRRVLQIVARIIRRSAYIALLYENRAALQKLVDVCEQSAYLAREIERFPLLLDELLDPRIFTTAVSVNNMRIDIAERLQQRTTDSDNEHRIELLSQYQRATLFRIAIADFSGKLPVMKVSDALTALAELVLAPALEMAWQDLTSKHGSPSCVVNKIRQPAGLGVIAYGKFGGMELSYGSDLDLVFLHDSAGSKQQTDGKKSLENNVFFARLVRRLVHFLTTQTSSGALYDVDTRLRPSGQSGLLVTSLEAFERYQIENAWTWEHQALLRSRPVAGSVLVNRAFERIRSDTLKYRVDRQSLAENVQSMRARMRQQLNNSTESLFDLKQGPGGIADLEFLVQYQALRNAADNEAVIHYRDNIRQLGTLEAAGCLTKAEASRLQSIYRAYRARLHALVLDRRQAQIDDCEFREERRFVMNLWTRELGEPPGPLA